MDLGGIVLNGAAIMLLFSAVLQGTAAVLCGIVYLRQPATRRGWLAFAVVMVLMTLRRAITLVEGGFVLSAETVAMLISVLSFTGAMLALQSVEWAQRFDLFRTSAHTAEARLERLESFIEELEDRKDRIADE